MVVYVEIPKTLYKSNKTAKWVSKIKGYKVNTQKSVVLSHRNSEYLEIETIYNEKDIIYNRIKIIIQAWI